MRMRKKKNLVSRMERCGDRMIRDPYDRRGHWRDLMPRARELRLELGCGKGRFTAGTAAAEPDVLFIAVERVPDAMVVAMERCAAAGLDNVYFIDAKRRLTHGNFLKLYRQVLKEGGEIQFKTDNQGLFEFSLEELPQFGFALSEVTRNLHEKGTVGVMTDYEAKFHEQGQPICRLVGTMVPWTEVFPTDIRRVRERWLDAFTGGVSEADLGKHVLADGNYLWHAFSWKLVPCLEGKAAKQALTEVPEEEFYLFYNEYPPQGASRVRPVSKAEALTMHPPEIRAGADWYLVNRDFTWTYAHTHEAECGPYFCRPAES